MHKIVQSGTDSIPVPQLVFSKLGNVGGSAERREALFQVALYMLDKGQATAPDVARALQLPQSKVESALLYWEGAGLLQQAAAPDVADGDSLLKKRKKMTTREVVSAGRENPGLGMMLEELQRLFGTVIGESDINLYVTLQVQDGFSPDLILLAATEALANGAKSAKYVERVLQTWRGAGIHDCAAADRYLKLQAQRTESVRQLAQHMGLPEAAFSLADKKKVAVWFEEYGFGYDMIDAARLVAGDKRGDIRYLNGVLKRWHSKGYTKPKDLKQGGEGQNLRVTRDADKPKKDLLAGMLDYVPTKRGEP